ncbi:DNA-binding protein WhiA [Lactobacillus sanfranciscensis]|uniref:Probable cell division protein WhiA n=1 Tax=Fructilactobacillus sanfranciscensis (strain TMW 1.1304) TaxID=714313 RepID=G2KVE9_FRUST|nr:DNA-binding protein WhiA [Fructilactobacillus sanfranciscensis]AEN98964.1 Putative sporulation transcription regulator whiA [Fructilactobacillus sanfranciscensis TMW 1.1304]NDR76313.1 DNA-binding protein WhiA [Fructilactobacillus sanfranciscensis]NDR96492.1 DNA-binding protein WhiA [Fructilactobacillus sanfranciscensis]NDS04192.1 DNA-binding protein WhiA [Fructilactobacillus sanfranciscensis]POH18224.1 DNA-binding protein WhiA [Fructilactobacillus sanfranciscensis]
MSYASEVKKELTNLEVHRENAKAELMALIRMNGTLKISNGKLALEFQSENSAISCRVYSLLLKFYQVEANVIVRRKMKLKKNNLYIVRLNQNVRDVLEDLEIFDGEKILERVPVELLKNDMQVRSYLRGAFLAGGSVNNPETSRYHLEIYSLYDDHNQMMAEMMNKYNLGAKETARRSGYIVYIKEAEKIADFLQLIGATNSMLKFEDIRIVRDMRNSVNRLVNCENANMNKVANASTKQIENIKFIEEKLGLDSLPKKLRDVAITRMNNQEVSLKELGEIIPGGPISKSGVNHRLHKINDLADQLRENA